MREQDTATPGSGSTGGSPAIKLDGPNLPGGGGGGIKEEPGERNIKQEVEEGENNQQQNGQNTDTSSAGKRPLISFSFHNLLIDKNCLVKVSEIFEILKFQGQQSSSKNHQDTLILLIPINMCQVFWIVQIQNFMERMEKNLDLE